MKFLKKCSENFSTQPNPRESEKSRPNPTQPNPTHGSTQPMNKSGPYAGDLKSDFWKICSRPTHLF